MNDDPTQAGIAELVGAVRQFEGTTAAYSRKIHELRNTVMQLDAKITEEAESRKTQTAALERGRVSNRRLARLALAAVMAAVVVMCILVGVGLYAKRYQDCINHNNDTRQQASLEFYQHIEGWASGQLTALTAVTKDPAKKAQATADFIGSYQTFIDYAQTRVKQLSQPAPSC